jgi:hypothetical protein
MAGVFLYPAMRVVGNRSRQAMAIKYETEINKTRKIKNFRQTNVDNLRWRVLQPNSNSDLPSAYHILTASTVLILSEDGNELGRFEGEGPGHRKRNS